MKRKIIFGLMKGLAQLPFSILYLFSDFISFLLYYLVKYRRKIVWENLTTSFPEKSEKEIKEIEKNFYRYLGDQIIETVKTLHLSDKELKKRIKVLKYDIINASLNNGRNVVILMGHYCNWEWVQEISRYFSPKATMVSIYHPLNDKVFDDLFIQLRKRWGANIIPMNKATRYLLNKSNQPWACGFIADAWTWQKHEDNCVDFLNHKTWFITGPEEIGKRVGADYFYLEMSRRKRGYYDIRFHKLALSDISEPYPYLRAFWKEFENTIRNAPAYWLWSHKRWK